MRFCFVWAGLLGLLTLNAVAQPVPDTTYLLPPVTVTATRTPVQAAAAPARLTVLEAATLRRLGADTVADALEAQTGVFIRRYGAGGLASMSLRGTGASQTAVLLDGLRLTDPQLGQLDLALLPSVLLDRAEVMHGPASAVYGSDALGGVLHLRSYRPTGAPAVRAQLAAGAFGDRATSALVAHGVGRWQGAAAAEWRQADGAFSYLNTTTVPARSQRRTNADRQQGTLFGTLAYTAPAHSVRLGAWYSDAERGLPGLATTPATGERQWDRSLRLWGQTRVQAGATAATVKTLVQRSSLRYLHPGLGVDDTGRTWTAALDAEAQRVLGRRWLAGTGLAAGLGTARHPSLQDEARDARLGAFVHGTGQYGPLLLYPALRVDAYWVDGVRRTALSPRLGANLRLGASPLRLKASLGRAFRMPTFNDRFWQPGGDPTLQPERGWMADAGVHGAWPRLQAELGVYAGRVRDQIVWQPTDAGFWAAFNNQRVQLRGLEASLRTERPTPLGVAALALTYTLTDARDRSDPTRRSYNQPLRYVPLEQATVRLGLTRTVGPTQLGADLLPRYVGRRYVTTDGDRRQALDPFVTVDAGAFIAAPFRGGTLTLAVDVDNLADRPYAVIKDYPLPPRHARVRLLFDLSP
ncbi:MAG: TonB-dependent receptor [Bacteroidota bacterium]